jgi:hypothetical protein
VDPIGGALFRGGRVARHPELKNMVEALLFLPISGFFVGVSQFRRWRVEERSAASYSIFEIPIFPIL